MDMKNVYARDENGEVKRKQPCQTPGCDYPNWHICLVGKPDTTQEILREQRKQKEKRPTFPTGPRSESHRQAHAAAMRDRWERINSQRDAEMVEYYKTNRVGYVKVAEVFGVSRSTAHKALKAAEARGEIVMRKPGRSIMRGAK